MADLYELTTKAFAPGGPLESELLRLGVYYEPNPKQVEYAQLAAKAFMGDGDLRGVVTLLQGATGTGKTLAYLVPLLLGLAQGRCRGLVSTYTLFLQRQVIGMEFAVAAAVVRGMTGADLTVAPLKGMRNFISARRVEELREALARENALDPEVAAVLDDLAAHPGGDISEWLQANELPRGVRQDDICLLPGSDAEESRPYVAHREAAAEADLVVTTHAMILLACLARTRNAVLLPDAEGHLFEHAVVDEAHRVPDAAESIFNTRVSVPMLEAAGDALATFGQGGVAELCGPVRDWMDKTFAGLRADRTTRFRVEGAGGFVLLAGPAIRTVRDEAREFADSLQKALAEATPKAVAAGMPRGDAAEIDFMAHRLGGFVLDCDQPSKDRSVAGLRWSPVRQFASFSSIPLYPGRLAAALWAEGKGGSPPALLRSIILTSATLDAPGAVKGGFSDFREEVGLKPWHRFNQSGSAALAPERFGRMEFVLADRRVPVPSGTGEAEEPVSDPDWIAYVARGLAEVRRRGGRALVLIPSYRDVENIARAARDLGLSPIEHVRGTKFADHEPAFLADPDGMLLTPVAWEGVNLRGHLAHLVIPRVPYPAIDRARNRALVEAFAVRGIGEEQAEGLLFAKAAAKSRQTLEQGIGRLIRSARDGGTVWILDPRFPLPRTVTSNRRLRQSNLPRPAYFSLSKCIPERFREGIDATYEDAEVFLMDRPKAEAAE